MNEVASHLANRGKHQGVVQVEVFYRNGSGQGINGKRKERFVSGKVTFTCGRGEAVSYQAEYLSFWGMKRVHVTEYLTGVDQKTWNCLLRLCFGEKLKLQLGLVLSFGLVTWPK